MRAALFNRDRTKVMISIGFTAVFVLMLLTAYLSVTTLSRVNSGMADLIHNNDQKTSLTYQMRDVIRLRSAEVRAIVQTNNPEERERIFDKLLQSTITYNNARTQLVELGANARENEVLSKIASANELASEAYEKAGNEIYSVIRNDDALKSTLNNVQLRELVLLNHLNGLVELEKELATEALAENQQRYKRTRRWLIASVFVAFIVSLLISGAVITRVTAANKRIQHLANHDDLTGLKNRRSFVSALTQTLDKTQRSNRTHGLLYLDFDRFKIVNDSCGHHAGDQLLIQLSGILQNRLDSNDLFTRVGGDEFVIIAERASVDELVNFAEELRISVQNFNFEYNAESFKVSVSIGVLPLTGKESDVEAVLQDVDSACYVAKQLGRNRVHLANDNDTEVVQYKIDIAAIQSIRHALDENQLSLYYQPVHRILESGTEMAHCEILLRIIDENGDLFSPAVFIPIAEKYNLMPEIDRWVVKNVLAWIAEHQIDREIPRLLINLSGLSFIDADFLDFVVEQLETNDIDPSQIAFEITETAAVNNVSQANTFINRLRGIGCGFALDDFGTGFSTFAYVKSLPLDYLKIDGSLVKDICTDSVDREMVRAINTIGHTVGAKTIAEFVENDDIVEVLRSIGVDYAQGFGLQRPGPLDGLLEQIPGSEGEIGEWRKAS